MIHPKPDWTELLKQIEDLLVMRINGSEPAGRDTIDAAINSLRSDFISTTIGISLAKEQELIIALALLPHIKPGYFDTIIGRIFPQGADLTELGGVKGSNHRGFIPTAETALFLIAGYDVDRRLQTMQYFNTDHAFSAARILYLERVKEGEPLFSGRIILEPEVAERLLFGTISRPRLSVDFPAKRITTDQDWHHLIISDTAMAEVKHISEWIEYNQAMVHEWDMKHTFKVGYRALFYGPSGTGKTFTATLLGKKINTDVYRIDISQVVSKFIGETEKSLESIFKKAEDKNWILFFDEADALFGKRISVSNAHDRYANQETSYLLQRIEEFSGLVILATNNKHNMDQAFARRFNAMVHFPGPDMADRRRLWRQYLPSQHTVSDDELSLIAKKYEVTGSTIVNAIQNASLKAFAAGQKVNATDIHLSIRRELLKEDKTV